MGSTVTLDQGRDDDIECCESCGALESQYAALVGYFLQETDCCQRLLCVYCELATHPDPFHCL